MSESARLALCASPTDRAQEAERDLRALCEWVPFEEADTVSRAWRRWLHAPDAASHADTGRVVPAYGMNLGTVGFLMNRYKSSRPLEERIARARRIAVSPLKTKAITNAGTEHEFCAINEVSLLRETRRPRSWK
jgi:NAD+ kinase